MLFRSTENKEQKTVNPQIVNDVRKLLSRRFILLKLIDITCDKSRDYRKDGLYISIFSVLIPYQQVLISSKEVLILCICSTIIYNLVSERKLSTLQIGISAYI